MRAATPRSERAGSPARRRGAEPLKDEAKKSRVTIWLQRKRPVSASAYFRKSTGGQRANS